MPNKRSALCVLSSFLFPTRNFHQPDQTRLKSPSSSMQLHLSPPSDLNLNRHVSVPPPLKINRPNSQKKKEANLGHTDFWYFNSNCDLREVKHQKTLKKSSLSLWVLWRLWMCVWFSSLMAASKLVIFSIFLALIFTHIRADVSIEGELSDSEDENAKVVRSDGPDSSALKIELDQLKSKIQALR